MTSDNMYRLPKREYRSTKHAKTNTREKTLDQHSSNVEDRVYDQRLSNVRTERCATQVYKDHVQIRQRLFTVLANNVCLEIERALFAGWGAAGSARPTCILSLQALRVRHQMFHQILRPAPDTCKIYLWHLYCDRYCGPLAAPKPPHCSSVLRSCVADRKHHVESL